MYFKVLLCSGKRFLNFKTPVVGDYSRFAYFVFTVTGSKSKVALIKISTEGSAQSPTIEVSNIVNSFAVGSASTQSDGTVNAYIDVGFNSWDSIQIISHTTINVWMS